MDRKAGEDAEIPAVSGAGALTAACISGASEDSCESLDDKRGNPLVQMNGGCQKSIAAAASPLTDDKVKCPIPVNLKKDELQEEESDVPLNLSLKVSLSVPPSTLVPAACQFCSYKTFYPEVLAMHKSLVHKDKAMKKSGFGAGLKQKRLTGCPPALEGRDVGPLPTLGWPRPRRTKSPLRLPTKPEGKLPPKPALAPRRSPVRAPPQESQLQGEAAARQQPSRFTEPSRKAPAGSRSAAPDRATVSERSFPRGSAAAWRSDAARLCLASQFGPLPPIEFGELSSKRLKYVASPCGEADAGLLRGPVGAGPSRLLLSGRGGKSNAQPPSDSLGASKTTAAVGGGLDGDWSMMNLLSSYSANELASLYHAAPPPPAHVGLATRAGTASVCPH